MEYICDKHFDIISKTEQRFYNTKYFNRDNDVDYYKDIIKDMESALLEIRDLTIEAKEMWINMENWLKRRKEIMIEKWIEEYYKSN